MAKKRGNNEGSITQRKDGRWQAAITLGRDPTTGKLKRATFYAKTRQEAADKLTKALHDRAHGTFVAPHQVTLVAWLDTWLWEHKQPSLRPITFDSYEMLVRRHLKPALGAIALRDLRPAHLQRFYNEKATAGFSARTVRYLHTTLHSALAHAEKNHLVVRNVSTLTQRPGAVRPEMHTLSLPQVADTLLPQTTDDRLYAAYFLVFMTGLRREELLARRWRDVDLHAGVLQVRQTLVRARNHREGSTQLVCAPPKTSQSRRTVPIPAACLTALQHHRGQQAAEKLRWGAPTPITGWCSVSPMGSRLIRGTVTGG
jgi:integrase